MTIELKESLEALEQFAPEWSELYRRCPRATPFQSPQWLLPWTQHLYGGGRILCLALRQEGALAGFVPLFRWGTQARTISFVGAGVSDYGDLLFAPGQEGDCVRSVRNFLAEFHDWDILDLQELRSDSALLSAGIAEPCSVCPVLELSTYPDSMDHKHRTDLRRARNRLEREGGLHFDLAGENNFEQLMGEFFHLYDTRWGTPEPAIRRFHEEVAARFLASGNLWLSVLRIHGTPAAAIYAFSAGATLYCYLSGFDPERAKLSPGAVLLGWMIEDAIAKGVTTLDFLRHPDSYKYLWGAQDRINYKLTGLIDSR